MDRPDPGKLRPSGAHLWSVCAGSHALQAHYPQEDSDATREGRAAHWFVSEALAGRVHTAGTLDPDGTPLTDEMIEGGQYALDVVAAFPAGTEVWSERFVTAHNLIHPLCEGTPDIVGINRERHELHIPDYKYGHRYVTPVQNVQLLCYYAGVCEAIGLTADEVKGWRIVFTVIQPRNFHPEGPVRHWTLLGWQAWRYVYDLHRAAHAAAAPDAPCVTNDGCGDCTGRHACKALQHVGQVALDLASDSLPHDPSPEAAALLLRHLVRAAERIDALKEGIEAQMLSRMRQGVRFPGWGVEQGKGRDRWTVPVEQVKALGDAFGVVTVKESPLTPKQTLAALRQVVPGLDETVIRPYYEEPAGKVKLVQHDDLSARKVFGE